MLAYRCLQEFPHFACGIFFSRFSIGQLTQGIFQIFINLLLDLVKHASRINEDYLQLKCASKTHSYPVSIHQSQYPNYQLHNQHNHHDSHELKYLSNAYQKVQDYVTTTLAYGRFITIMCFVSFICIFLLLWTCWSCGFEQCGKDVFHVCSPPFLSAMHYWCVMD